METIDKQESSGRPRLLAVLLVLSFISIVFNLLFTVFFLIRGPLSAKGLKNIQTENAETVSSLQEKDMSSLAELFEKIGRMEVYVNQHWYVHHVCTLLVLLIGLAGVLFMSRAKLIGFHFYIVYSILTSAVVYISVPFAEVAVSELIVGLLFSFLFIWLYSRNLSFLK